MVGVILLEIVESDYRVLNYGDKTATLSMLETYLDASELFTTIFYFSDSTVMSR